MCTGPLLDPVVGRPGYQIMGLSGAYGGRLSYMFFKFNSETY